MSPRPVEQPSRKTLDNLAVVRGGYIVPTGALSASEATTRGLQASDLNPDGTISWPTLRTVSAPRDLSRYAVRERDVLLPLRSMRMAAVVARDVPPNIIAVGSWALLTPHTDSILPEFLAWYLNHPTTARRLGTLSQGSSLQFLSLGAIREFEIEFPSIEVQRRIANADRLQSRVTELEQQLTHARKQLVDALTMDALRAGTKTDLFESSSSSV